MPEDFSYIINGLPPEEQERLQKLFEKEVKSARFKELPDEGKKQIYSQFGRTYVPPAAPKFYKEEYPFGNEGGPVSTAQPNGMQKSPLPQAVEDASNVVGGLLSGGPAGAVISPAVGRLVNAVTGQEPEGGSWTNVLSMIGLGPGAKMAKAGLGPAIKQNALKNAAIGGLRSGAAAELNNRSTKSIIEQAQKEDPERGNALSRSPMNRQQDWLRAAATGAAIPAGLNLLGNVAGTQAARRTVTTGKIDEELKRVPGTTANPAANATGLLDDQAAREARGYAEKVFPSPVADVVKRTGLDIKSLNEKEYKLLKEYAKQKPEEIYDGVLSPIFEAKSKEALPVAAQAFKKNLDGLTKLMGAEAPEIKKGLGKQFAARLVDESGDGRFANPETLLFRMEQIGKPVINEMFGSAKAYDSLQQLASIAKSQKFGTGLKDASGAGSLLAFTKVGILVRAIQSARGKEATPLGNDNAQLIPWHTWMESLAKRKPKTINLLAPGNQRFTRNVSDDFSAESSESSTPVSPIVPF